MSGALALAQKMVDNARNNLESVRSAVEKEREAGAKSGELNPLAVDAVESDFDARIKEAEDAVSAYRAIAENIGKRMEAERGAVAVTDEQGNPVDGNGRLVVDKIDSIDSLTDDDFVRPSRSVELPALPANVDAAIGADGKPVVIKKNIFEKNWESHKFASDESRAILKSALYNTDLVGQTQPSKKPFYRVAVKLDEKSPVVILEVNDGKENTEIVGWYTLDERNLERIKRQADRNGGELVILSPKDKVESLSTPPADLSSAGKDSEKVSPVQEGVPDERLSAVRNAEELNGNMFSNIGDRVQIQSSLGTGSYRSFGNPNSILASFVRDERVVRDNTGKTRVNMYKPATIVNGKVVEAPVITLFSDKNHRQFGRQDGMAIYLWRNLIDEEIKEIQDYLYSGNIDIEAAKNPAARNKFYEDIAKFVDGVMHKDYVEQSGITGKDSEKVSPVQEAGDIEAVRSKFTAVLERVREINKEIRKVLGGKYYDGKYYDNASEEQKRRVDALRAEIRELGKSISADEMRALYEKAHEDYWALYYDWKDWRRSNSYRDENGNYIEPNSKEFDRENSDFAKRASVRSGLIFDVQELAREFDYPLSGVIYPVSRGSFGFIYDAFRGDARGAVRFLTEKQGGEATGALHHPDVGDISLVWGDDKSGLKKILDKHPEIADDLQGAIDGMSVVKESDNRIKLESDTHFAVVSKDYKGEPRDKWLLTAYEKKNSARDNSIDTGATTLNGVRNDTATPQNTVSSGKDSKNVSEKQSSVTRATPDGNRGGRAVASDAVSEGKDSKKTGNSQDAEGEAERSVADLYGLAVPESADDIMRGIEVIAAKSDSYENAVKTAKQYILENPVHGKKFLNTREIGYEDVFRNYVRNRWKAVSAARRDRNHSEWRDAVDDMLNDESGVKFGEFAQKHGVERVPVKKGTVRMDDFAGQDRGNGAKFWGVYHKDGEAVSSDGVMLFAKKADYDKSLEGKVVVSDRLSKKFIKMFPALENDLPFVDAEYPDYHKIVPDTDNCVRADVDLGDMRSFVAGVREEARRMWEKDKSGGRKRFADYYSDFGVAVRTPDGIVHCFTAPRIEKFLDAADVIGSSALYTVKGKRGSVLCTHNDNGTVLLMPIYTETWLGDRDHTGKLFAYDASGSAGVDGMQKTVAGDGGGDVMFQKVGRTEADYERAVRDGDMDKAREMVVSAAKATMPDTKVVDENGEPLVVYHRTNATEFINKKTGQNFDELDWKERDYWQNEASDEEWKDTWEERDFNVFNTNRARHSMEVPGFFFAPKKFEDEGYGKRRISAYLNIKNPITDPDFRAMGFDPGATDTVMEEAMRYLQSQGYDGIINTEDGEPYEYVAFNPSQIKLADPVTYDDGGNVIPLSRRFDFGSKDIRYSTVSEPFTDVRTVPEREAAMRDGLVDIMRSHGIDVITDDAEGQRVLDEADGGVSMLAGDSERRRKRGEELDRRAEAMSVLTGGDVKEERRKLVEKEAERRRKAQEVYNIILSGDFNDVSLQKIQDFINDATPERDFGRRVSERLPQEVERRMLKVKRGDAVEALFTRASESSVPANERVSASGRRKIAEKKKELLKKWAEATGRWHTEVSDFTDSTVPLDSGHDSDVYMSRDGRHVIKLSGGKDDKRFRSDPDAVTLFNYIFPNSSYRVLGYGDFGKGFVRVLEQPYVDFAKSTPLTVDERAEYMKGLGFEPMNREKTAFSNGKFVVADLQKNNIVRDDNGVIRVIDADVKLHTKDSGGEYSYLPVEHDLPSSVESGAGNGVSFFKTSDGDAYGFVKDGKMYIDPRIATSEAPLHEYVHLWIEALKEANPKAWEHLKGLLRKYKDLVEFVRSKYPELTDEDKLLEEVFAHYSGQRGAERMRAEMDAEMAKAGNDILLRARVKSVFSRIRQLLDEFWNKARDLFAGKVKGLRNMSAEDFADMSLNDLLNGFNPNERGDADKTLMGSHNISEEKLRKALKNGGLANPSIAVTDTRKGIHTGYGEITLIPSADKLDRRTGRNAGTWTSDAWTPTYPQVSIQPGKRTGKVLKQVWKEWSSSEPDEAIRNRLKSYLLQYANGDNRGGGEHLQYQFLKEKGIQPKVYEKTNVYDKEFYGFLKNLSEETGVPIMELVFSEHGDKVAEYFGRKKAEEWINKLNEVGKNQGIPPLTEEEMQEETDRIVDEWKNKKGALDDEVYYVYRLAQRPETETDVYKTFDEAVLNVSSDSRLRREYEQWLSSLDERLGMEEKLFAGYTPSGFSRYVPNTVENASKLMNKGGQAGNTPWSGPGPFAANVLEKANTLDAMRRKKGRLNGGSDLQIKAKVYIGDEFYDLSEFLSRNGIAGDRRMLELTDVKGDVRDYAKREWGIDLSEDWVKRYHDLVDFIRKEYPVNYFETKFNRPVRFNEFSAAVVPSDTDADLVRQLEEHGIKVSFYERGNEDDRARAVISAAKVGGDVMFQKGGRTDAPDVRKTDADYERAVRDGDMEKAREMVASAAKAAMTDTKVVDKDGNPLVVYHGTEKLAKFNIFKRAANWFSSDRDTAEGIGTDKSLEIIRKRPYLEHRYVEDSTITGKVYEAYLSLKNPLIVDAEHNDWDNIKTPKEMGGRGTKTTDQIVRWARKNGYDGVIIKNVYESLFDHDGSTDYIAFSPSQIKSAAPVTYDDGGNVIPLSRRFDFGSKDIRYSRGAEPFTDVRTEAERRAAEFLLESLKGSLGDGKVHLVSDEEGERMRRKWSGDGGVKFMQDGFRDGMSFDEVYDALWEKTDSNSAYDLILSLEHYFGGELVSASSGTRFAMSRDLVPVPGAKYSGEDEEYHHMAFRDADGEVTVQSVPFVKYEDAFDGEGKVLRNKSRNDAPFADGVKFMQRPDGSVYGKQENSLVNWINNGKLLYVGNKEALQHLCNPAPIAETANATMHSSVAKIVKEFENPSIPGENVDGGVKFMNYFGGNSVTWAIQRARGQLLSLR